MSFTSSNLFKFFAIAVCRAVPDFSLPNCRRRESTFTRISFIAVAKLLMIDKAASAAASRIFTTKALDKDIRTVHNTLRMFTPCWPCLSSSPPPSNSSVSRDQKLRKLSLVCLACSVSITRAHQQRFRIPFCLSQREDNLPCYCSKVHQLSVPAAMQFKSKYTKYKITYQFT